MMYLYLIQVYSIHRQLFHMFHETTMKQHTMVHRSGCTGMQHVENVREIVSNVCALQDLLLWPSG